MKSILFVFLVLGSSSVFAQKKTEYSIYGVYYYDSLGNQYQVSKKFDHTPTHEDSVAFYANEHDEISKLTRDAEKEKERTDSIYRSQLKKQNTIKKAMPQKRSKQ